MASDAQIMFMHIREGEEIAKFVRATDGKAKTLLIRPGKRDEGRAAYGNVSDDCVEQFDYDYYYVNDLPLEEAEGDFVSFLAGIYSSITE